MTPSTVRARAATTRADLGTRHPRRCGTRAALSPEQGMPPEQGDSGVNALSSSRSLFSSQCPPDAACRAAYCGGSTARARAATTRAAPDPRHPSPEQGMPPEQGDSGINALSSSRSLFSSQCPPDAARRPARPTAAVRRPAPGRRRPALPRTPGIPHQNRGCHRNRAIRASTPCFRRNTLSSSRHAPDAARRRARLTAAADPGRRGRSSRATAAPRPRSRPARPSCGRRSPRPRRPRHPRGAGLRRP